MAKGGKTSCGFSAVVDLADVATMDPYVNSNLQDDPVDILCYFSSLNTSSPPLGTALNAVGRGLFGARARYLRWRVEWPAFAYVYSLMRVKPYLYIYNAVANIKDDLFIIVMPSFFTLLPKGGRECLFLSPCLVSQGCPVLLPNLVRLSFSFFFCWWPILSPPPPFRNSSVFSFKKQAFCTPLV